MVLHKTVLVDGLSVFYREAGAPGSPKLVLLGGFPASSHQFRNLIPALANRFHVLSPDYPGFGNTDMPDPKDFAYTFDHLSEIVEGLLGKTGFTRAGFYMQDYGGPVGFRILGRKPEWMEWLILQNTNAYEEGFTAAWDGIRHALWKNPGPQTEGALMPFLELEGIKLVYQHGHAKPELISPDNWQMDFRFMERPERPTRSARSVLRLPHERRALPGVAGVSAGPPSRHFDPVGTERHLLHARRRGGVPAGPPQGRGASPRVGALRRRGLPGRDCPEHPPLLRREGVHVALSRRAPAGEGALLCTSQRFGGTR